MCANLKAAWKALCCRHPHFKSYSVQTTNMFGSARDGRFRTITLNTCLRCGKVRIMSAQSAALATPARQGQE